MKLPNLGKISLILIMYGEEVLKHGYTLKKNYLKDLKILFDICSFYVTVSLEAT